MNIPYPCSGDIISIPNMGVVYMVMSSHITGDNGLEGERHNQYFFCHCEVVVGYDRSSFIPVLSGSYSVWKWNKELKDMKATWIRCNRNVIKG